MATFKSGFGLQETFPTTLGGSKGQAAAPYPVVAIVPAAPGTPAFNPTKNGFGLPIGKVIVAPVVDTTPADGYLDFAGGVANPKDGFGLPMTMVPHASSTPQPTAIYKGYATV
jgi:hypothetical protein